MLTPVKHDNNGFVSINNVNNEPMLKIIDKGNGTVDLNSASDKNVLSIGAKGDLNANGNLTTKGNLNLNGGDLNIADGVLNTNGAMNIGGTTSINSNLFIFGTSYFRNEYLEVYDQNLNLNGVYHLNMQTGDLNVGSANNVNGGNLSVNGGNLSVNDGHLIISGSTRGTFSVADPGTGLPYDTTVSNSNVTANSVILITIKAHTSGAIAGVYVSSKTANSGFTVNNTNCIGTFDYVIIN